MRCWNQGLRASCLEASGSETGQDLQLLLVLWVLCPSLGGWTTSEGPFQPKRLYDLTWQNEQNGGKKWNAEVRMSDYQLSFKIFLGHGRAVFWRCAVASKRLAWEREQRLLLFDGRAPSGKSSENACCLWEEHGHLIFFYHCKNVGGGGSRRATRASG